MDSIHEQDRADYRRIHRQGHHHGRDRNEPQPSLFPRARFDGGGLTHSDHLRLGRQLTEVLALMQDGVWRTLREISQITGAPEASVSARLRDAKKAKFGGYVVQRRNLGGGLFVYRMGNDAAVRPAAVEARA